MGDFKLERLVVLIVDDEEVIRKIIIDYMTSFGFKNFLEAPDGAEAYRFVLDQNQRIDLIISDWEMPRTDGLTLLKVLREHRYHANTPFIMVTSQQSQERMKISQAKRSKVDSYIVKPFRGETLKAKVWEVLGIGQKKPKAS